MKSLPIILLALLCCQSHAVEEIAKHQKGNVTITQKDTPANLVQEYFSRLGYTDNTGAKPYIFEKRTQETWKIYVPESYDPKKPSGIFYFISSNDNPGLPKNWRTVINKHNVIWVAAQKSGNKVFTYWRHCLALNGIKLIKERYNIDTNRIFLGGNSGGGRAASILSIYYPEIIKGANYHVGCNFWGNISLNNGRYTPGFAKDKKIKTLKEAQQNYYVFTTGTKDFNLEGTKNVHAAYLKANFKNCKLTIVDGLGHSQVPAEAFDQALTFLDTPKAARGKDFMAKGLQMEKLKKWAEALKFYRLAIASGHEEAKAKESTIATQFNLIKEKIKSFNDKKNYYAAFLYISQVVKKYGKGTFPEAEILQQSYKKDKAILMELKGAVYLAKVERALKSPKASKEKIKLSLLKVIKNCPGTFTSQKAQTILDSL